MNVFEQNSRPSTELMHFGIKKRSGRYPFGSGDRPYQHDSAMRAQNHSWKERRTMSDEDLDKALQRARKENELYNYERNNRSVGQKFVEDVLTQSGKKVLTTVLPGAALYGVKYFITNEFDKHEFADFVTRGGKKKDK